MLLDIVSNQECQFQRLIRIEAWIANGMIAIRQIILGNGVRTTGALGHILAGHFHMHTTGVSPLGAMHSKEAFDFFQNALERAGLVAIGCLDHIAMHRIARPKHLVPFPLDRFDKVRKMIKHLVGPKARDQRQSTGFIIRV